MDWKLIMENTVIALVNIEAAYFALAAMGLNVHFGYTGLLNFGQAGFMAMGAYGIAIAVVSWGLSLWAGVFIGLLAAVVLALLLGFPTLRLRADYLAIVTIAASEIIRLCMRSVEFEETTGGSSGLQNFTRDFYRLNPFHSGEYGIWFIKFSPNRFFLLLVAWSLVALGALFIFLIMRSPWGRVVKAIREDEDAVRALGKNVYWYKMQSLVIGGVFGAVAGMLFALANSSVQPDNYSTLLTIFAFTALILGGAARVFGPIAGSMFFWALLQFTDNVLRQAVSKGYIPESVLAGAQVGQVRLMLVGIGLMLLAIFRPQGIFGNRREIDLGGH